MDIPPHKFFVKILENALVYYALHLVGETLPAFMDGQMLYQLQGIHYINLVLPLLATEQCTVTSATGPSQDKQKKVLEQLISRITTFLSIEKWATLQIMKTEWYGKVLFK